MEFLWGSSERKGLFCWAAAIRRDHFMGQQWKGRTVLWGSSDDKKGLFHGAAVEGKDCFVGQQR